MIPCCNCVPQQLKAAACVAPQLLRTLEQQRALDDGTDALPRAQRLLIGHRLPPRSNRQRVRHPRRLRRHLQGREMYAGEQVAAAGSGMAQPACREGSGRAAAARTAGGCSPSRGAWRGRLVALLEHLRAAPGPLGRGPRPHGCARRPCCTHSPWQAARSCSETGRVLSIVGRTAQRSERGGVERFVGSQALRAALQRGAITTRRASCR